MAEPVTATLRRALRLVEARRPDAWAAMGHALEGLRVEVRAPDRLVLASDAGRLVEDAAEATAEVRVQASREAIVALLHGETTLTASLRSGAVEVAGATGALVRALEAFEWLVGALLRIEGADALRRELEKQDD